MSGDSHTETGSRNVSRRSFVRASGATLAGGLAVAATPTAAPASRPSTLFGRPARGNPHIRSYKTLGRTGWRVSDIGFGTGPLKDSALARMAFDRGINYFDTAESYGNGAAERAIGEALPHIGRENVFIATKIDIRAHLRASKGVYQKAMELAEQIVHSIREHRWDGGRVASAERGAPGGA